MTTKEYFIGLKKDSESKEWRWISSGSKVYAVKGQGKSYWARNEPNGDGECAVMYNYNGKIGRFNDLSCTIKRKGYICESSVDRSDQEGMLHKLFFSI